MAENAPSWIDWLNLGMTTLIGALGVYVAVQLGRSADQLGKNGLVVASATFLLDDSPQRRQAGVQIVTWLQDSKVELPQWEQDLVARIASQSNAEAPTRAKVAAETSPAPPPGPPPAPPPFQSPDAIPTPPAPPPVAAPTSGQIVADQLFRTVGGTVPRLFIQIADPAQRDGAEALRAAIGEQRLRGQLVIVPGIQAVSNPPAQIELRFLKAADHDEAGTLAGLLGGLLAQQVKLVNLSARYEAKATVKARTYELWFPHFQAITVAPPAQ